MKHRWAKPKYDKTGGGWRVRVMECLRCRGRLFTATGYSAYPRPQWFAAVGDVKMMPVKHRPPCELQPGAVFVAPDPLLVWADDGGRC